jgi:uncharacterized protein
MPMHEAVHVTCPDPADPVGGPTGSVGARMIDHLAQAGTQGVTSTADLWVVLLAAGVAVMAGAVVQSTVGLGLGLVAAPVVSFLDPTLMPGSMLIAAMLLPVLTLLQEWRQVDWRGVGWGVPARIPGTVVGVWVVAVLEPRALAGVIGAMVLGAVVLSVWSFRVRISPGSLMAAGCVSGITGTATSVGGPPIALLYQYEPPPRVRATLAAFFLFGAAISVAGLTVGGQMDMRTVVAGLATIPCVAIGFGLGNVLRRRVETRPLRMAMLCVVAASALALLLRAGFG